MGAIDVGAAAIDRFFDDAAAQTWINRENPANDSGTLTSFKIWAISNMADTKVGTFSGSGTSWNDRDFESIGSVTAGSEQTFSGLDCDVETNDVCGIYYSSGLGTYDSFAGAGAGYKSGDQFGSGAQTYNFTWADGIFSLYGTGETAAGGWSNIAKVNGIASASIGKINGIAVASIGKINGVAV